jgi:glycyl-tRNA synthetase alpha subunit
MCSLSQYVNDLTDHIIEYILEKNLLHKGTIISFNDVERLVDMIMKEDKKIFEDIASFHNMKLYYFNFNFNYSKHEATVLNFETYKKLIEKCLKRTFKIKKILPIIEKNHCENTIIFEDLKCLGLTGEQKELILKRINDK